MVVAAVLVLAGLPAPAADEAAKTANRFYHQGMDLLAKKEPAAAIVMFDAAIKAYPDFFSYHLARGAAYYMKGDWARADGSLRRAIELKRDNWESWSMLGDNLAASGRYRQALDAYQTALRYCPQSRRQPLLAARENVSRKLHSAGGASHSFSSGQGSAASFPGGRAP